MAVMQELEHKRMAAMEIKAQERDSVLNKAARMQELEHRAKYIEQAIKNRRKDEIERDIKMKKADYQFRAQEERIRDAAILRENDRLMEQREYEREGV